jgi:uncharacterized integral membrane protein
LSKILSWIISIPLALLIIVFSLVNRTPASVDFWPFPTTMEVPLFALILVALMIGVVWGGMAAWLAAGRARKRAREMTRRAEDAEMEVRHQEERATRLQRDLRDARTAASKDLVIPADAA